MISFTLADLRVGDQARISQFTDAEIGLKLLEMGCVPGASVKLVRFAPWGDPLAFECNGSIISIRNAEARTVDVERM